MNDLGTYIELTKLHDEIKEIEKAIEYAYSNEDGKLKGYRFTYENGYIYDQYMYGLTLWLDYDPLFAYYQLIDGGTQKSCYIIRDKALIELALHSPRRGFMAFWDGQSKGTRHTADYAKKRGIAGVIYNPKNEIVERWKTSSVMS